MTNKEPNERAQIRVATQPSVLNKARVIAKEKRMTFEGFIGLAIEQAVKAEEEKDDERCS